MAVFDAAKEGYILAVIDGRLVLFTNMRLDRDTVPEGLFCYDIQDSDRLDGCFAEVRLCVVSRHWGTILCREPFPLDEHGSYIPKEWEYFESLSLAGFLQASAEQLAALLQPKPTKAVMPI